MKAALWCVAVLGMAAGRGAAAQQPPDSVGRRAEQLQSAGRFADGVALLSAELEKCGPATEQRACRAWGLNALGYLHQRQVQFEPDRESSLLTRAVEHYRGALVEGSGSTSFSNLALAYRDLGREDDVQRLLQTAIAQDAPRAGRYLVMLAESQERQADWAGARTSYARAIATAPNDEIPRRRLVEVYRHLPVDSTINLFHVAAEWETLFPEAAARAYEFVVTQLSSRERFTAIQACLRWVRLLSETQLLTAERLDAIGSSWLSAEMGALKAFIRSDSVIPRGVFWRSTDQGEALGRAALALGRRQLTANDPAGAERYFTAGIKAASNAAPVSLDLVVEVAALYARHAPQDTGGLKLSRLEDSLFFGKSEAYQRADQEAIQELHTVLGLLYARRGLWESRPGTSPWRNAVFQLDRALQTARGRDAASGSYQALPELRAYLAQGYEETGRATEARRAYVDAARAYLDVDRLTDATRMLARSSVAAAPDPQQRALEQLIRARATTGKDSVRPTADLCRAAAERTTQPAAAAGFDAGFLKRQQFKLLADCVLAGPAAVRPQDAAQVYRTVVNEKVPLTGVDDLIRVRRMEESIKGRVSLQSTPQRPDLNSSKLRAAGPALQLQMPSESRATYITVDPDILRGADVLQHLDTDAGTSDIRIQQGAVIVGTSNSDPAARARIQQKLRSTPNVTFDQTTLRPDSTLLLPRPRPEPPEYVSARAQAMEARTRAVSAGATWLDLAEGDSVARQAAAALVAQDHGDGTLDAVRQGRAMYLVQRAGYLYDQAARVAAARRDAGKLEVDSKAELETVIARYARALETRNIDSVRRVVPRFDEARLGTLFKKVAGLQAELQLADLAVEGDRARGTVTGTLRYRDPTGRIIAQDSLKQQAIFVRGPRGWQMAEIQ